MEHHQYKSRAVLDQQEMFGEGRCQRLFVSVHGSKGRSGRVTSAFNETTYEPRRLPFPALEELDIIISNLSCHVITRYDLYADPFCNLC